MQDQEQIQVESRAEWRAWLTRNHVREEGVWVVTYKKHTGDRYVPQKDLVEEAICFGWIDSLPRKLDEDRTMLWIAPRQKGSGWSRVNKEIVERMIASGRMTEHGLAKIEAAKQDGSWSKLDAIENLEIPDDLDAEFDAYDAARENFENFPRSVKRGILEWIANARRPATRRKRVEETARLAQENIRANQWRQ